MTNIFLAHLCHFSDCKQFDTAIIYKPLIDDLNDLAKNGIELTVDGSTTRVYLKLALIIGDNLALHSTLGFVESFSANFPCRFRKVGKIKSKYLSSDARDSWRDRTNYATDLCLNNTSLTGIKKECIWNRVVGFHATENYSVDIMHDLLEGVCKSETGLLLKYLIATKQHFTLENLNDGLKYFRFPVIRNLINCIELKNNNIRMTASEMLSFILYSALIFGDLVPEGDKHWKLYILLRKILCICLSTKIAQKNIIELENTISRHHMLFAKLHGRTLKPKHHHMLHFPRIMREIGPLQNIWSMRYEAKHQQCKQIAAMTRNRVNICRTLALKNQLNFNNDIVQNKFFPMFSIVKFMHRNITNMEIVTARSSCDFL